MKGIPANVPYWVLALDAANGDPLRAQEIEEGLTMDWWQRWKVYRREQGRASEKHIEE